MSVEEKVEEQKCPHCGAMLHYDPNKGKLVCDYCDYTIDLNLDRIEDQTFTDDFRFDDFKKGYEQPDAEKLPIYNCKSCGAELIAPATQISLTCPYCRNNIVLTDKISGNLRPNGILPFEVTADQLPKLLNDFYKGKKLLPKNFFSKAAMSNVTGVYVPFWLFSGNVDGDATFMVSKNQYSRRGDYSIVREYVYEIKNHVHAVFDDVPVDASKRIRDDEMDSIEPFDTSKIRPFDTGYLAGYVADRFDTPSESLEARAKLRLETTANAMLKGQVGSYSKIKVAGGNLKTTLSAKYYLLPVYKFRLKYAGRDYSFAVNGQTGAVAGELPNFKKLSRVYFLKRFLPPAVAIIGAFVIKYFIGG